MHHRRLGQGPALLLLHGLGSSINGWAPLLPLLESHFTLYVPDLPGFGRSPAPEGGTRFGALVEAIERFQDEHALRGAAVAGFSMGGQLALELLRRGRTGPVAALAPGGFWMGWERAWIAGNVGMGLTLVRAVKPLLPPIAALPATRSLLFAQFCARPWAAPGAVALEEARNEADSPGTDPMLLELATAPMQAGLAPGQPLPAPLTLLWGREDRVTLPAQAARAQAAFPGSRLHWVERAGHYIHWDQPAAAAALVRQACGARLRLVAPEAA